MECGRPCPSFRGSSGFPFLPNFRKFLRSFAYFQAEQLLKPTIVHPNRDGDQCSLCRIC